MSLLKQTGGLTPHQSGGSTPLTGAKSLVLSAGDRVGEYVVGRLIGRGGMGCVYEARDEQLDRTVALKTLLPGAVADPPTCDRILSEARALAAIGNAHVVTVHRVGVHEGVPYLVLERLSGEPLSAVLARGPVPLLHLLKVGREIAHGLAAAHRAGLVHRDVKPENIFLDDRRDRAVLIDFGLVDPRLPAGFGLIGSPPYMPPEQVRGEPLDGRADLYSLGAVLYRACTGRLPIPLESLVVWKREILSGGKPPSADRFNPTLPLPFSRLLDRLLAKNPADRPTTATEVEWELADLLRAVADPDPTSWRVPGGSGAVPPTPRPPRRPSAGRAVLVGAGLAVGLIAVGAAGRLRPPAAVGPPVSTGGPQLPRPRTAAPVALFDGHSLAGWHNPDGGTDRWRVTDGVLIGTPDGGPDQFLLSDREFTDFVLEFEFRWTGPGGHTTVMVRAKDDGPVPKEQADAGAERVSGLEVNLGGEVDPELDWSPPLYASGGVYKVRGPRVFAPNNPLGEWNRVRVTHLGHRLTVEWNGALTFDEDLSRHSSKVTELPALARHAGGIALQTHGTQPIEYRRVTVAEVER